jgi:hypothetical protein
MAAVAGGEDGRDVEVGVDEVRVGVDEVEAEGELDVDVVATEGRASGLVESPGELLHPAMRITVDARAVARPNPPAIGLVIMTSHVGLSHFSQQNSSPASRG